MAILIFFQNGDFFPQDVKTIFNFFCQVMIICQKQIGYNAKNLKYVCLYLFTITLLLMWCGNWMVNVLDNGQRGESPFFILDIF